MTSTWTTRKRLERQTPGENNNTWGQFLNNNTIDLLDECFGVVCVAMTTAGDSTLSTQNGSTDEGRRSQIILTGAPTTTQARLFVPAVQSFYLVRNKMTGSNKVRLTNTGGTNGVDFSGSGSGAEQGLVASDGTNVREIFRTVSAGSFSIFTRGMIMPFYGSVGGIPTGWLNCDGTNGTPNLNQRFILGTTSNTNVDTSGGSIANITTTSSGDHAHGGTTGSHTLTVDEIPAHNHLYNQIPTASHPTGSGSGEARGTHTVAVSTSDTGGGGGHTHTIATGGGHTHTVTPTLPPYHYLLYIMKS